MRERLITWGTNVVVMALATAIPVGLFMCFYTDNGSWLWLCMPLLIFLS